MNKSKKEASELFDKDDPLQKELKKKPVKDDIVYPPKTLEDVETVFKKWLYMENFEFLHTVMAQVLSNQKKGTPVWIIHVATSGDRKSVVLRSFRCVKSGDVTTMIDDITNKTLASGGKLKNGKPVKDLGYYLQDKSTVLITPDLASLTAKDPKEKREIWAKMRELFDGYINLMTGNDVKRAYEGCHVTWLFGATPSVKNEVLIFTELGTRELLNDVETSDENLDKAMDKAWDNEEQEEQMKKELKEVVAGFMNNTKYNETYPISNKMRHWIQQEVKQLELFRASTGVDKRNNTIYADVKKAKPMRTMKQFKKLYIAYKSINPDFTDEYIKKMLHNITVSNGNPIRLKILELNKKYPTEAFSIDDYEEEFRLGGTSIHNQANILWNMGVLIRNITYKTVGQIERQNSQNETYLSGGRTIKVHLFKLAPLWQKRIDDYISIQKG